MAHWKKLYDYNYLGDYSFDDGKDKVLTIKTITEKSVMSEGGRSSVCPVIEWVEKEKPMVLNKTNCRILAKLFSSDDIEDWVGKTIQLFKTTTKMKGEEVGCIRIRPKVPTSKTVVYNCEICKKEISEDLYLKSLNKYGHAYCSKECKDVATNGNNFLNIAESMEEVLKDEIE